MEAPAPKKQASISAIIFRPRALFSQLIGLFNEPNFPDCAVVYHIPNASSSHILFLLKSSI